MARFPETGLSAVLELSNWTGNVRMYLRDVDRIDKAEGDLERSTKSSGRAIDSFGTLVRGAGEAAARAARGVSDAAREADRAGAGFSRFASNLLSIDAAMNIADRLVGAFGRVSEVMGDLAQRAADMQSVGRGFEVTASSLDGYEQALARLREQSHGAVSDLELMRLANKALINSSEEFSAVVGPNFGTVIQAAFAGASATGQDLNIVLDKIVTGIRRQSNMLLDDIGIWVTAEEAQARYAAQIGVSVASLNEEQKAAAFAQEAIRQMGDVITQSGFTMDSMALQSAQATAAIENNLNTLAVAAGPSITAMQSGFMQIGATMTGALAQLDPAPFFEGGANIIAAIAHGILSGLTFVVQAATQVAQVIANFLRGFSPPKEGPLSDIDVGGANIVKAWLDEFDKVSLGPVEGLAGSVSDIMNNALGLGTEDQTKVLEMTLDRVQERLNSEVAKLSRGEGDAATVQALDEQRIALQDQLKMLKERGQLEQIFGTNASQAQAAIAGAVGGTAAAAAAGASAGGSDYTKPADEGRRLDISQPETGKGEKDKLADLQGKLAANVKLQDEYNAAGLETNDLLREQARLTEQIAAEESARGLDNAGTLSALGGLQAQLATPASGGGGGGGAPAFDMSSLTEGGGPTGLPPMGGGTPGAAELADMSAMGLVNVTGAEGGPISQAFAGIQEDIEGFVGAFEEARDTLEGIDLFGAVREFFDAVQAVDTPEELITFLADLTTNLLALPGDIIRGIIEGFESITGIELPGWLTEGVVTSGAIALITAALGALAGAVSGLLLPFIAIAAPIIAIGALLDEMNTRWGGFEGALQSVLGVVEWFRDRVAIVWDEISNAMGAAIDGIWAAIVGFLDEVDKFAEGLGIDLGIDVSGHIDELEARAEARELRSQLIGEMRAIMGGAPFTFSPELQAAAGTFEIPPEVSANMRGLMRAALETENWDAAITIAAQAASIGLTLDQDQRDALSAEINRLIAVEPLDLTPQVTALIAQGAVTLDASAMSTLGAALDQLIGEGDFPVDPNLLVGILNGTIAVSDTTRELARQAVEASITGEGPLPVETAQAVINNVNDVILSEEARQQLIDGAVAELEAAAAEIQIPGLQNVVMGIAGGLEQAAAGAATRSGGVGGPAVPPSISGLMGAREAAAQDVSPLTDILAARGGGAAGGGMAGGGMDTAAIEESMTRIEEMIAGWSERLNGVVTAVSENMIGAFLIPLNEQLPLLNEAFLNQTLTVQMFGLTLTTANLSALLYLSTMTAIDTITLAATGHTTALTGSIVGLTIATGTGLLALMGLDMGFAHYIDTVDEANERTLEFIQIVNAIPKRIDVVLGVTIEVPNLTSLGAGIASAMQGADMAAIGGARAEGGPVNRGAIYLVGENGPELFVPSAAGQITPISAPPSVNVSPTPVMVQGGGTTINQSFGPGADAASMGRKVQELRALGVFG